MRQQLQQPQTQQSDPDADGTTVPAVAVRAGQRPAVRGVGPPGGPAGGHGLNRLETALERAKSRARDGGLPRVAARWDDLAENAHLGKDLLIRQSPFTPPIEHATLQGVQELRHRASESEVQEALSQAQMTAQTIQQALATRH